MALNNSVNIILVALIAFLPVFLRCELNCQPNTLYYIVGQNVTLLDVSTEDISLLPVACTKEITIPDASLIFIYVEEANFGGNKGFQYSSFGMTSNIYTDSAFLTNKCSNQAPLETWKTIISKGTHLHNKTDRVCIKFVPELKYRSLGYHTKGGRLKVSVKVELAYCNTNNTDFTTRSPLNAKSGRDSCRPLCSANGFESSCDGDDSSTNNNQWKSARPTSMREYTPGLILSTAHQTPSFPQSFSTGSHPTGNIKSDSNTSTAPTMFSLTAGQKSMSQVTQNNFVPTRQEALSTTENRITGKTVRRVIPSTNKHASFESTSSEPISGHTSTRSHSWSFTEISEPTTKGEETTDTKTQHTQYNTSSSKTFGLIEGLYVLVGCIVVSVLSATIIYYVRSRKHTADGLPPVFGAELGHQRSKLSDISYISQWRDNWFVQYNTNSQEGGKHSDSEHEDYSIHGDFVHKSNHELHNIYRDSLLKMGGKQRGPYDKPWPLIRLDSEFVKTTKSIEGLPIDKGDDALSDDNKECEGDHKRDTRLGQKAPEEFSGGGIETSESNYVYSASVKLNKASHSTEKNERKECDGSPGLEQNVSTILSDSGVDRREFNDFVRASGKLNRSSSSKNNVGSLKERSRKVKRVDGHLKSRGFYNVVKAQRTASLSNYETVEEGEVAARTLQSYKRNDLSCKKEHHYHEISDVSQVKRNRETVNSNNVSTRQSSLKNSLSICSESSLMKEKK